MATKKIAQARAQLSPAGRAGVAGILRTLEQAAAEWEDPDLRRILGEVAAMRETTEGAGWVRLVEVLNAAADDPKISASPGASRFVQLVARMASDSGFYDPDLRTFFRYADETPNGARGKQFAPRGRGEGKLKKLVRRVLPGLDAKSKAGKAATAEVWSACKKASRKGMDFYESHVYVDGEGETSYGRFKSIVSEVRHPRTPAKR